MVKIAEVRRKAIDKRQKRRGENTGAPRGEGGIKIFLKMYEKKARTEKGRGVKRWYQHHRNRDGGQEKTDSRLLVRAERLLKIDNW